MRSPFARRHLVGRLIISTPGKPSTSRGERLVNAFALSGMQVAVWPFAMFWMTMAGMSVAGCGSAPEGNGDCKYAVADAAYNGLPIAFAVIAVLTFAVLMLAQRRGWKLWPVAVAGFALTLFATYVAHRVLAWALLVI